MKSQGVYCPTPEFLNLSFGVVVALPINLLSSVALMDDRIPWVTVLAIVAFSISAAATGALALTSSRIRDDAVLALGSTLTEAERRAEIRHITKSRSGRVVLLEVVAVVLLLAGSILLAWR